MPHALTTNARLTLADKEAHYLTHVLRLKVGDAIAVFNAADGEWFAVLDDIRKKHVTLRVESLLRTPRPPLDMWVCFAPVKAGRLESILEKATELGASVIQPVITARTVVDKINAARAEAIIREAAEQCERTDWPALHAPVSLPKFIAGWPEERLLIYGDESGNSPPALNVLQETTEKKPWAILTGPEGGFTEEEFALLRRVPSARGVWLGPRILRADTAVASLASVTAAYWGDWNRKELP